MSLLINQPSKLLCFGGKPVSVRSSRLGCNGLSSSSVQTPLCFIVNANPCGGDLGKLKIVYCGEFELRELEKKVPLDLMKEIENIGSSNGWVATLKAVEGIVRLQDDLNPSASDTNPKRISLPPLVTLPYCQTQIVTNIAMSSASPEDEDCVVAVKFVGRQISFCRPARKFSEWTNVWIGNSCFFSSRVMFSKIHDMFRIPGSGGHIIGSWDLHTPKKKPKFQRLRFRNLPKLTKTKRELLVSCQTSEHLVESPSTGETFLVKWYRKTFQKPNKMGIVKLKTQALMVFKLDEEEGSAVYTQDIKDLCIVLSKAEPSCLPASSVAGLTRNHVFFYDVDEFGCVDLADSCIISNYLTFPAPYHIPPQNLIS